jgi:hypothetical protein
MATDKATIRRWVTAAKDKGYRWVIIACDTFDYDDYPVEIEDNLEKFWQEYKKYNKNMQRVMEVYDLVWDIEYQLNENLAMHTPEPIEAED